MKAKVVRGGGFRGALNYAFGKDEGVIVGGNMSNNSPRTLAAEFAASRKLRPDVEKAVWHCSLSATEGERLSDEKWGQIAADFVKLMKFGPNHQFTVVRHKALADQKNPDAKAKGPGTEHVHIYVSRISLTGDLWSGEFEALNAIEATQKLEKRHGLVQTVGLESKPDKRNPTKNEIEKALRTGEKPPRMVIQDALASAFNKDGPTPVQEFIKRAQAAGVEVKPNISATGKLNGFSFGYDGVFFTGQKVGAGFTWSKLQEKGVQYEQARDAAYLAKLAGKTAAAGSAGASADTDGASPEPAKPAGPAAGRGQPDTGAGDNRNEVAQSPEKGHAAQGTGRAASPEPEKAAPAAASGRGGDHGNSGVRRDAVAERPSLLRRFIDLLKQIAGIKAVKESKAAAVAKPVKAAQPAPATQTKSAQPVRPEPVKPVPQPAPAAKPTPQPARPVVPHGHVDRDDPISSQARRREQEREELSAAISKWLGGGGKATDSIGLLRRAIDGDDVSAVKKLLEGSAVNDRTCAVKDSDLDRAAERQCSDPLFKLLVRGEGTANDTDSLKQLADRFKKGSAAGSRLQELAKQVKANGGDLESVGLIDPTSENKNKPGQGQSGPSIGGGGGGPKMGK